MATIHISEAEAANNFAGLMARARAGEEVMIESPEEPTAVLKLAEPVKGTCVTEVLARLKAREEQRGYALTMDDDFVADMEAIVAKRKPADRSAWD
jgi:antitoxin (DNA-binding transcriptional repressor) of toxin-antitoxin stability system